MTKVPEDLRQFISLLQERGEVRVVKGADWDLEIGAINEMMAERRGPALLFDQIKGYPPGFRIATNILHRADFQKIAFGIPEELSNLEVVRDWNKRGRQFSPVPPKVVDKGTIM